ncbi:serine/threonine protein phosphatase [Pontibacter qinzhouensis]|uniref:Serine/threonine protein phosphatase n=1 Tax=Pontibacter qinzhouensis TaxID=2603253 RepID=A0A5C8JI31_9BACT|nr:metallophosphoesterase [Pontibacter qinzhouensis]TXK37031.1 serine/threonine protein phosphatase [Pontibacter qinzhouensis]
MKRFVTSDSHGGCKALQQCLDRAGFDMEQDQLIFLGDVVDGWPETKESIDLLLQIKNLVYLLGNHDQWALDYYTGNLLTRENELELWLLQGGTCTVKSYGIGKTMPKEHLQLLQQARPYYETDDNRLFVHAGFDTTRPVAETDSYYLIWNREFLTRYYTMHLQQEPVHIEAYKEIFIGHTPTIALNKQQHTPLQLGNITLMDTGAAFTGCLSIMDIDSGKVWQSEQVMTLYPEAEGRNGISYEKLQKGLRTFELE